MESILTLALAILITAIIILGQITADLDAIDLATVRTFLTAIFYFCSLIKIAKSDSILLI